MKSTRLILIRHGESQCNLDGLIGGEKSCTGLSTEGFRQVKLLAKRFEASGELVGATALYASTLLRAIQTAEGIASQIEGVDIVVRRDLSELMPGDADGLKWMEFFEKYGETNFRDNPFREVAPNGESWASFIERAANALMEIVSSNYGERVVVACHGGVIQASMVTFLGLSDFGTKAGLRPYYTSVTDWKIDGDSWRLLKYNDYSHLKLLGES